MYIFEAIIKFIKGKKYQKLTPDYNPEVEEDIIENPQECEHLFMPLDSSNEFFGCKYCGFVVPKSKLKDKNIFSKQL